MIDVAVGLVFGTVMAVLQGYIGRIRLCTPLQMGAIAAFSGAVATALSKNIYDFMLLSIVVPSLIYLIIYSLKKKG